MPAVEKKSKATQFLDGYSTNPVHIPRRKRSTSGGAKPKPKPAKKENRFDVEAAGRMLRDVETVDIGDSAPGIKNLTRLPSGVVDIDENVADLFLCPEYAEDMFNEQDRLQLSVETLQTCVALMDKVLSKRHIEIDKLQLLGITCLFIATKYHEYSCLKIMSMAKFILDATLISIHQVQFSSSMRAASALLIARKLFDCEESWTPGLAYYSKYSEKDLLHCFQLLVKVLVKAPKLKFQGAMSKYYSNPEYRNIRRDPYLAKLREWQGS